MVVRRYLLPVDRVEDTDSVRGIDLIHDAALAYGVEIDKAELIMDTDDSEHASLADYAIEWRDATAEEAALLPKPRPPARDYLAEIDDLSARVTAIEARIASA